MSFHRQPNTFVNVVSLNVSKLERSLDYYEKIIGFQIMEKNARKAILTADGETPLVILEQPDEPLPKAAHQPGLYHFAILLPTRANLGAFLQHIIEKKVQLGASDHIVSEALYLSDPDGNGIEVYADRPPLVWQSESGKIRMSTDPLQVESLLKEAKGSWNGLPVGTMMGHIHLHVTNLDEAKRFYCDGLGFDVVYSYPQALFMSTGGYHHHIAVNTWNRATEAKFCENQVGLQSFSILYPCEEARKEAIVNLQNFEYSVNQDGNNYRTEDPSGNQIQLNTLN